MLSVRPNTIDTNRFKYYSAIKTGFGHMDDAAEESVRTSAPVNDYLQAPTHVVDEDCIVFPLPLMLRGKCVCRPQLTYCVVDLEQSLERSKTHS